MDYKKWHIMECAQRFDVWYSYADATDLVTRLYSSRTTRTRARVATALLYWAGTSGDEDSALVADMIATCRAAWFAERVAVPGPNSAWANTRFHRERVDLLNYNPAALLLSEIVTFLTLQPDWARSALTRLLPAAGALDPRSHVLLDYAHEFGMVEVDPELGHARLAFIPDPPPELAEELAQARPWFESLGGWYYVGPVREDFRRGVLGAES